MFYISCSMNGCHCVDRNVSLQSFWEDNLQILFYSSWHWSSTEYTILLFSTSTFKHLTNYCNRTIAELCLDSHTRNTNLSWPIMVQQRLVHMTWPKALETWWSLDCWASGIEELHGLCGKRVVQSPAWPHQNIHLIILGETQRASHSIHTCLELLDESQTVLKSSRFS
jgi:hypothetical protein